MADYRTSLLLQVLQMKRNSIINECTQYKKLLVKEMDLTTKLLEVTDASSIIQSACLKFIDNFNEKYKRIKHHLEENESHFVRCTQAIRSNNFSTTSLEEWIMPNFDGYTVSSYLQQGNDLPTDQEVQEEPPQTSKNETAFITNSNLIVAEENNGDESPVNRLPEYRLFDLNPYEDFIAGREFSRLLELCLHKHKSGRTRSEVAHALCEVWRETKFESLNPEMVVNEVGEMFSKLLNESVNPDCAICLDDLTADDSVTLKCGHSFHSNCLDDWLECQMECPLCRKFVGRNAKSY